MRTLVCSGREIKNDNYRIFGAKIWKYVEIKLKLVGSAQISDTQIVLKLQNIFMNVQKYQIWQKRKIINFDILLIDNKSYKKDILNRDSGLKIGGKNLGKTYRNIWKSCKISWI